MTDPFAISTTEEYRALRGDGGQAMYDKSMDVIDDHIREFLALTTFVTIASFDADGNMDVSPKGDRQDSSRCSMTRRSRFRSGQGIAGRTRSPTFSRTRLSLSSASSQGWMRRCASTGLHRSRRIRH